MLNVRNIRKYANKKNSELSSRKSGPAAEKYDKYVSLMERLSGWRILQASEDGSLSLELLPGTPYLLKIQVDPVQFEIIDISLDIVNAPSTDTIPGIPSISDIVQIALEEQNLEFALREIQHRILEETSQ